MKLTMKTMTMGCALVVLNVLPLAGQAVVTGGRVVGQSCDSGVWEGHLGISGLDCVGECSVTLTSQGSEDRWVFSTEPRIFGVEEGGPSDGIFRPGDYLVALDGVLITTRRGGQRYANLTPGEVVTVRFRRDGEVHEAAIRVGGRCRPNPPQPVRATGRVTPPPPPRPDQAEPPRGIATAPRVRVVPDAAPTVPSVEGAIAGYYSDLSLMDTKPTGRLGIGFSCQECGTDTSEDTGESIWFFSGPLEVTQVNSGGPAERAGIRMGDLIKAIDGHDITSQRGGVAFSRLTPGQAVEVTLIRRNGREETVELVPEEPSRGLVTGWVAPSADPQEPRVPRASASVVTPSVPNRVDVPEPTLPMSGPEDLPVSYSGMVGGVEVLVRGGPVSVSELQGARTLFIRAEGIWVRIRVPAGVGRGISSGGSQR
jgi:S1-C subfamily serine protease